jgi:type II secretory pathway pseudopilin PulG
MRTMVLSMSWPLFLIMLGGLLTLVGAGWQARRQAQTGAEVTRAHAKVVALTQQLAARGGDQKPLEELIETRPRLAVADRRNNDEMMQQAAQWRRRFHRR